MTTKQDDSFQLFDLRVEVVCPSGKKILYGAKQGDFFTLKGEMLYLPPGQGISIYSLGMESSSPTYRRKLTRLRIRQRLFCPY